MVLLTRIRRACVYTLVVYSMQGSALDPVKPKPHTVPDPAAAVAGAAAAKNPDCVLPFDRDPRYFKNPALDSFLRKVQTLEERKRISYLREIEKFQIDNNSGPEHLDEIGLLEESYALFRTSLPPPPPRTLMPSIMRRREKVEAEIVKRFKDQKWFVATPDGKRLDWTLAFHRPESSELVQKLFSGTKGALKIAGEDRELELAFWEFVLSDQPASPLIGMLRGILPQPIDKATFPQLTLLQYTALREHLLNLYEARSLELSLADSQNPALQQKVKGMFTSEQRALELRKEHQRYCQLYNPLEPDPEMLGRMAALSEDKKNELAILRSIRQIGEFVETSGTRSGHSHGIPLELRQKLEKLPVENLKALAEFSKVALDKQDHQKILGLVYEAEPTTTVEKSEKTGAPNGHLTYFERATKRDADFYTQLGKALEKVKFFPRDPKTCEYFNTFDPETRQRTFVSPFQGNPVANWKSLSLQTYVESPLEARGGIFNEAVSLLQPPNFQEIYDNPNCDFADDARKSGRLLMERELYSTPHELIALYQLIGLHLGWKATPQEIARDILDNFPDKTSLPEITEFRKAVLSEGSRYMDLQMLESSLTDGGKKAAVKEPNVARLKELRTKLGKLPEPFYLYGFNSFSETVARNPHLLPALEVSPITVTLDLSKMKEFGMVATPFVKDAEGDIRSWIPGVSTFDGEAAAQAVEEHDPTGKVGNIIRTLTTPMGDMSPHMRTNHVAANVRNVEKILEQMPDPARKFAGDKKYGTRAFFDEFIKQHEGKSLTEQNPRRGAPDELDAAETEKVRRYLQTALDLRDEGKRYANLQRVFHLLESEELGLFKTKEQKEKLRALRLGLRTSNEDNLFFTLESLVGTLLRNPEALDAISVTPDGLSMDVSKLKQLTYFVIPNQKDPKSSKYYANENFRISKTLSDGILAKKPSDAEVFAFYDQEHEKQFGVTLKRLSEMLGGSQDPDKVRSVALSLLKMDQLSFAAGAVKVVDVNALLGEKLSSKPGETASILSKLLERVPSIAVIKAVLNGGEKTAPETEDTKLIRSLHEHLNNATGLIAKDTQGFESDVYKHVSRHFDRVARYLYQKSIDHNARPIQGDGPDAVQHGEISKLIDDSLSKLNNARTVAAELGFGQINGTKGQLFYSPKVTVTFIYEGHPITVEGVPSTRLTDPWQRKKTFWLSLPLDSPSCEQLYPPEPGKHYSDNSDYRLCSGVTHPEDPLSMQMTGDWTRALKLVYKTHPEKFRKIMAAWRAKEALVLNQVSTNLHMNAIRDLAEEMFDPAKQGDKLIIEHMPEEKYGVPDENGKSAKPAYTILPTHLKALEKSNPVEFKALVAKYGLPLEAMLTPFEVGQKSPLHQFEERLQGIQKRITDVRSFATQSQKEVGGGHSQRVLDRLKELANSGKKEDTQFYRDLVSYVRYFPTDHSFRNLVYGASLPPHLKQLLDDPTHGKDFKWIVDTLPSGAIAREWVLHESNLIPKRQLDAKEIKHVYDRMNMRRKGYNSSFRVAEGDTQNQIEPEVKTRTTEWGYDKKYGPGEMHVPLIQDIVEKRVRPWMESSDPEVELLYRNVRSSFTGLDSKMPIAEGQKESERQANINMELDRARAFFLTEYCNLSGHLNPPAGKPPPPLDLTDVTESTLNGKKDRATLTRLMNALEAAAYSIERRLAQGRTTGHDQYPFSERSMEFFCDSVNAGRPDYTLPSYAGADPSERGDLRDIYEDDVSRLKVMLNSLEKNEAKNFLFRNYHAYPETILGSSAWGYHRAISQEVKDAITVPGTKTVDKEKLKLTIAALDRRIAHLKAQGKIGQAGTTPPSETEARFIAYEDREIKGRPAQFRWQNYQPAQAQYSGTDDHNEFLQWASKEYDLGYGGMDIRSTAAITRLPVPVYDMLQSLVSSRLGHVPIPNTVVGKRPDQLNYSEQQIVAKAKAAAEKTNADRKQLAEDIAKVIHSPWPEEIMRLTLKHDSLRERYARALSNAMHERHGSLNRRRDAKEKLTAEEENEFRMLNWFGWCERSSVTADGEFTSNFPLIFGNEKFPQAPRFGGFGKNRVPPVAKNCAEAAKKQKDSKIIIDPNSVQFSEVFAAIPSMTLQERYDVRKWAIAQLAMIYAIRGERVDNLEDVLKKAESQVVRGMSLDKTGFGSDTFKGNVAEQAIGILLWALESAKKPGEKDVDPDIRYAESEALEASRGGAIRFNPRVAVAREHVAGRVLKSQGSGQSPQSQFLFESGKEYHKATGGILDAHAQTMILNLSVDDVSRLRLLKDTLVKSGDEQKARAYWSLLTNADPGLVRATMQTLGGGVKGYQADREFDPVAVRSKFIQDLIENRGSTTEDMEQELRRLAAYEVTRESIGPQSEAVFRGFTADQAKKYGETAPRRESHVLPARIQALRDELRASAAAQALMDAAVDPVKAPEAAQLRAFEKHMTEGKPMGRSWSGPIDGPLDFYNPLRTQLESIFTFYTPVRLDQKIVQLRDELTKAQADPKLAASIPIIEKNLKDAEAVRQFRLDQPTQADRLEEIAQLVFPNRRDVDLAVSANNNQMAHDDAYLQALARARASINMAELQLLEKYHVANASKGRDRDMPSSIDAPRPNFRDEWNKAVRQTGQPTEEEKLKDEVWTIWQSVVEAREKAIAQILDGKTTILDPGGQCGKLTTTGDDTRWKKFIREERKATYERYVARSGATERLQIGVRDRNMLRQKYDAMAAGRSAPDGQYARMRDSQRKPVDADISTLWQRVTQAENEVKQGYKSLEELIHDDDRYGKQRAGEVERERNLELARREAELTCLFEVAAGSSQAVDINARKSELNTLIQKEMEKIRAGQVANRPLMVALIARLMALGGVDSNTTSEYLNKQIDELGDKRNFPTKVLSDMREEDEKTLTLNPSGYGGLKLFDPRAFRSQFIDSFALNLAPPAFQNQDLHYLRKGLAANLTNYFDKRQKLRNFASAAYDTQGQVKHESWTEAPLSQAHDSPVRLASPDEIPDMTLAETKRIMDHEWKDLRARSSARWTAQSYLNQWKIKFDGQKFDYSEAELYHGTQADLKAALQRAYDTIPRDLLDLRPPIDPWEQLQHTIVSTYAEGGLKPMFQLNDRTAVTCRFRKDISDYECEFHDGIQKKEEATKLTQHILNEFDRLKLNSETGRGWLLDLRTQNNTWSNFFGVTDDVQHRADFEKAVTKLRADIEKLKAYGSIYVDPEGKYLQKFVKDENGVLKSQNVKVAWKKDEDILKPDQRVQDQPDRYKPDEHKETNFTEKVGYQPADALARYFDFQKDHRVILDARTTLENIDADYSAMMQKAVISAAVVAVSLFVPPLALNASLLATTLHGVWHGVRAAIVLNSISEAYREVSVRASLRGEEAKVFGITFWGGKEQLMTGHSDTIAEFYKSMALFAIQGGASSYLTKWTGLGKLAVPKMPVLSKTATITQRLGWYKEALKPYLKHYGGHAAIGVGTMHTTSVSLDVATHLLIENAPLDDEMLEEYFVRALATDIFALGLDKHTGDIFGKIIPKGVRTFTTKGGWKVGKGVDFTGRLGAGFTANHVAHLGVVAVETKREQAKLDKEIHEIEEKISNGRDEFYLAELNRELQVMKKTREELTVYSRWANTLFQESIVYFYFAYKAARQPNQRLGSQIELMRTGDLGRNKAPPHEAAEGSYDAFRRNLEVNYTPDVNQTVQGVEAELGRKVGQINKEVARIEADLGINADGTKRAEPPKITDPAERKKAFNARKALLNTLDANAAGLMNNMSLADINDLRRRASRVPDADVEMVDGTKVKPKNAAEVEAQAREAKKALDVLARSQGVETDIFMQALAQREAKAQGRGGESSSEPLASSEGPTASALPEVMAEARDILARKLSREVPGSKKHLSLLNQMRNAEVGINNAALGHHSQGPMGYRALNPAPEPKYTWHKQEPANFYRKGEAKKYFGDAAGNVAREHNLDGTRFTVFAEGVLEHDAANREKYTWDELVRVYQELDTGSPERMLDYYKRGIVSAKNIYLLFGERNYRKLIKLLAFEAKQDAAKMTALLSNPEIDPKMLREELGYIVDRGVSVKAVENMSVEEFLGLRGRLHGDGQSYDPVAFYINPTLDTLGMTEALFDKAYMRFLERPGLDPETVKKMKMHEIFPHLRAEAQKLIGAELAKAKANGETGKAADQNMDLLGFEAMATVQDPKGVDAIMGLPARLFAPRKGSLASGLFSDYRVEQEQYRILRLIAENEGIRVTGKKKSKKKIAQDEFIAFVRKHAAENPDLPLGDVVRRFIVEKEVGHLDYQTHQPERYTSDQRDFVAEYGELSGFTAENYGSKEAAEEAFRDALSDWKSGYTVRPKDNYSVLGGVPRTAVTYEGGTTSAHPTDVSLKAARPAMDQRHRYLEQLRISSGFTADRFGGGVEGEQAARVAFGRFLQSYRWHGLTYTRDADGIIRRRQAGSTFLDRQELINTKPDVAAAEIRKMFDLENAFRQQTGFTKDEFGTEAEAIAAFQKYQKQYYEGPPVVVGTMTYNRTEAPIETQKKEIWKLYAKDHGSKGGKNPVFKRVTGPSPVKADPALPKTAYDPAAKNRPEVVGAVKKFREDLGFTDAKLGADAEPMFQQAYRLWQMGYALESGPDGRKVLVKVKAKMNGPMEDAAGFMGEYVAWQETMRVNGGFTADKFDGNENAARHAFLDAQRKYLGELMVVTFRKSPGMPDGHVVVRQFGTDTYRQYRLDLLSSDPARVDREIGEIFVASEWLRKRAEITADKFGGKENDARQAFQFYENLYLRGIDPTSTQFATQGKVEPHLAEGNPKKYTWVQVKVDPEKEGRTATEQYQYRVSQSYHLLTGNVRVLYKAQPDAWKRPK